MSDVKAKPDRVPHPAKIHAVVSKRFNSTNPARKEVTRNQTFPADGHPCYRCRQEHPGIRHIVETVRTLRNSWRPPNIDH